jgi:hypothetical protein
MAKMGEKLARGSLDDFFMDFSFYIKNVILKS